MQALLILYIVVSVVSMVLAIPLIQRKIKPNYIYGFRFPQLFNNPEAWYDVNAYGARWLFGTGVVTLIVALAAYVIPGLDKDGYAILCGIALVAGSILMMIFTVRYMRIR